MRSIVIVGNWKMNTSIGEAGDLVERMKPDLDAIEGAGKVVCPPFVALSRVRDILSGTSIAVGAQNLYHENHGAFTGEVSPSMLSGLCEYVIIGHSERRQHFGENDAIVGRKVKAALDIGLKPIMCVGEQLEEREEGLAAAIVEQQLQLGLARVETAGSLLVAYEPVWAIGTGRAATPEDAQAMMSHIRRLLARRFGSHAAVDIPLLYGGSVNQDNVASYVHEDDIDGALVGGASLNADSFVQLVRNAVSGAG